MFGKRETTTRTLCLSARIVGAAWTAFLLFLFVTHVPAEIDEHGLWAIVSRVPEEFVAWKESPAAVFYVYMVGYALTWLRPGVGGFVLLLLGAGAAIASGNLPATAVLYGPVATVGALHLVCWHRLRRDECEERRCESVP